MTLAHTNCIPQRRRTSILSHLTTWIALAHQRRALASLTDAQLDDIGVCPRDADIEANRPVWDVPSSWRR